MNFLEEIPTRGKKIYINEARNAFSETQSDDFPIESQRYIAEANIRLVDIYTSSVYMGKANLVAKVEDVDTGEYYFLTTPNLHNFILLLNTDSRNGVVTHNFKTIPSGRKLEVIDEVPF